MATRSLQLTQKKNSVTQKTLESALVSKDPVTNETISTSNRCMDLDVDIPNHLGVSRAVLENVIFVHQEESNWFVWLQERMQTGAHRLPLLSSRPLSEPSVLKKKFDEIFAATKYTKALQSIKDLRKEQAVELKLETQKLEFLKQDKERSDRVKKDAESVNKKIEVMQGRVNELDNGEIATTMEQLRSTSDMLANIGGLEMRVQMKGVERENIEKQIGEIEARIEVLNRESLCFIPSPHLIPAPSDSDEELQRKLDRIKDVFNNLDAVKADIEDRRRKAEARQTELQADVNNLLTKKGQLQARSDENARKEKDRFELITELAKAHGFRGFDYYPLSDEDLASFSEKLRTNLRDADKKLQELKAAGRLEEQELQKELQDFKSAIAGKVAMQENERRQMVRGEDIVIFFRLINAHSSIF